MVVHILVIALIHQHARRFDRVRTKAWAKDVTTEWEEFDHGAAYSS